MIKCKTVFSIMAQLQSHTEMSNSILYYRVSPKKGTNRIAGAMLLRLNHLWLAPLAYKVFWVVHTKTKQDQPLPSQVHGKIWAHSTQFWL